MAQYGATQDLHQKHTQFSKTGDPVQGYHSTREGSGDAASRHPAFG